MTRKALIKIFSLSMTVTVITAVVISAVFFNFIGNQVKDSLYTVASVVESQINQTNDYSFIDNTDNDARITLIAPDGTVMADNRKNASQLENHSDRTEFKEAVKDGESTILRKSDTVGESLYYYARQLDDGSVLRVAETAKTVDGFFSNILIYILIAIILVTVCSVFISIRITKSIIKPIEELTDQLDNVDSIKTYDELMPLVNALKQQKEKQKALDKQKKQFTANVSHELKTPLTSIAGYAELIESGMAKPEDIKPFASVIRKQALRLVGLSEDIIQLSQLEESDDVQISFESVDLYALAQKCVEALKINALNKNVELICTGESSFIKAKSALVEELIYNLCDNAIRYNKENGKVYVSVNEVENGTELCVRDTGIGIPEKYIDRIFERFFRVDKSRSKATGGTGLGLAIVKHIAQLHSADLVLNSKEGEGTEIKVTFKKQG